MALTQISTEGIKNGTISSADLGSNLKVTGSLFEVENTGGNANFEVTKVSGANFRIQSQSSLVRLDTIGASHPIMLGTNGNGRIQINDSTVDLLNDNQRLRIGAGNDLQIFHQSSGSINQIQGASGVNTRIRQLGNGGALYLAATNIYFQNHDNNQTFLHAVNNGAVKLNYSGSTQFETISGGANVTGKLGIGTTSPTRSIHSHVADGTSNYIMFSNAGTGTTVLDGFLVGANASDQGIVWNCENQEIKFATNNTARMILSASGHLRPNVDSTYDLGVNATRWRNVYADTYYGDGSNLTGVGGATGGGSDEIFYENSQTVTSDYTITSGKNAMSAGPITINNGVSVTVPSGSTYTIV